MTEGVNVEIKLCFQISPAKSGDGVLILEDCEINLNRSK